MTENGRKNPLMVFVHIPKTAGSSVNKMLSQWDSRGKDHCEGPMNRDPQEFSERLREFSWVSGHISRPILEDHLKGMTDRPLEFFTLVRDPISQICSHYNWLIEIFHRGEKFYRSHPRAIKDISARIRNSDNSNSKNIIENLDAFGFLFLNQQSRIALGKNHEKLSTIEKNKILLTFKSIRPQNEISDLIRDMTGQSVAAPLSENVSKYHFDKDIFRSPELTSFLNTKHAGDIWLYESTRSGTPS